MNPVITEVPAVVAKRYRVGFLNGSSVLVDPARWDLETEIAFAEAQEARRAEGKTDNLSWFVLLATFLTPALAADSPGWTEADTRRCRPDELTKVLTFFGNPVRGEELYGVLTETAPTTPATPDAPAKPPARKR